jgi:hypothetical protein
LTQAMQGCGAPVLTVEQIARRVYNESESA